MPDVIVSYVPSDGAWADWLGYEIERCGFDVALHRRDDHEPVPSIVALEGVGALLIPVLSPHFREVAGNTLVWSMMQPCAPVVVRSLDEADDDWLDLSMARDEGAACRAVHDYLGLNGLAHVPAASRLFGGDRPGFPRDLCPSWRVGPRLAGDAPIGDLERQMAAAGAGPVRVVTKGGDAELVEYAYQHAQTYRRCWSVEGSEPALIPAQLREIRRTEPADDGAGPGLLLVHHARDDEVLPAPGSGSWHVLIATDQPVACRTEAPSALRPPERALLGLLNALAAAPVPLALLRAGAAGAPGPLAALLTDSHAVDGLIERLYAAGLVRRRPDTVELTSTGRSEADGISNGSARNVVALATIVLYDRHASTADWLAAAPHVLSCLDRPATVRQPATLAAYLAGWEAGEPPPAPLASALGIASMVLAELGAPELSLRLAERGRALSSNAGMEGRIRAEVRHAASLRAADRLDEALVVLRRAEEMAAEDPDIPHPPLWVLFERAESLRARGDLDGALAAAQRLQSLILAGFPFPRSEYRIVDRLHAQILGALGRTEEALGALSNHRLFDLDDAQTGVGEHVRAGLLLQLGQLPAAREAAERACRLLATSVNPEGLWYARVQRAAILNALGRHAEGLAEAEDVIRQARQAGMETFLDEALPVLAHCTAATGDLERSLDLLDEVARRAARHGFASPQYVAAGLDLAQACFDAGRHDRAASVLIPLVNASNASPGSVQPAQRFATANLLAAVEEKRGRLPRAIAALKLALAAIQPDDSDATEIDGRVRLALSGLHLRLGQAAEAAEVVRIAADQLTQTPEQTTLGAQLMLSRARSLHQLDDPGATGLIDECVATVRRILERDEPGVLSSAVHLLLAMRRPAVALPYAHRAVLSSGVRSPERAVALDNLGRVLVTLGQAEQALGPAEAAVRLACELHGNDDLSVGVRRFNLAGVYEALPGRQLDAIRELVEVIRIDSLGYGPDHSEVALDLRRLADVLDAVGLRAEAERQRREADLIDPR